MERYLFLIQRITAMVLAPLVLIHLGFILYAVRDGLTGAEILARTQGNILWMGFYGLFVVAAAIHAPIGVRNILREWAKIPTTKANVLALVFSIILLITGMRAVFAVI